MTPISPSQPLKRGAGRWPWETFLWSQTSGLKAQLVPSCKLTFLSLSLVVPKLGNHEIPSFIRLLRGTNKCLCVRHTEECDSQEIR